MVVGLLGLAVDGGGSKTRVRLVGADGMIMGEAVTGASNLTYGIDRAWHAVGSACATAGLPFDDTSGLPIVAAMAGSREPAMREAFADRRPGGGPTHVVCDGYAGLLGALDGEPGSVAAVGTGVAVVGIDPRGVVRYVDGWGFPVGDEGGGSWLGLRAVRQLVRERDGRAPTTALGAQLAVAMELDGDDERLRAWLRRADATRYAALARVVVAAAASGDPVADRLLADAAACIGRALLVLDNPTPAARIALTGSIGEVLAPRLDRALASRVVPARGTSLDGATRLLRERTCGEYR